MLVPPPGGQNRLLGFPPLCHTVASDTQEHTWPRWGESEREGKKWGGRVRVVRVRVVRVKEERKYGGK